jgi:putative transposase
MNKSKVSEYDYIDFLIGTQRVYSSAEAERVNPEQENGPAHDAYTRQLHRLFPTTERLWSEAQAHVDLNKGCLIIDDSTLDKFYSRKIELVTRHWSGKHKRVVSGINLVTMLWTDGERHIPADCRIYNKIKDGLTKNDHFRSMLQAARQRGFQPEFVLFDSWHASLENLKLIRSAGWQWLTRLEHNRHVDPNRTGNILLNQVDIPQSGRSVHLKGYGMIKVFKIVRTDADIEYWASSDLDMSDLMRLKYAELSWMIETCHRGVKQFCGIERCQARSENAQRNYIELATRAFLRIEYHCFVKGISWFEAKTAIIRDAVRAYLTKPIYTLEPINLYATA